MATAQLCCGDEEHGTAYDLDSSKTCCGTQYVPQSTSLCCKGSTGDVVVSAHCILSCHLALNRFAATISHINLFSQVYNYTSAVEKSNSSHKCCGKERVARNLSCCNERGYDPSYQTCAAKSSNGTVGCGLGRICNNTDAPVAMCDRCDFDNTTLNCGYVPGYYDPSPTTAVPPICATNYEEVLKNQYNPNLRFYNDTNLSPHTLYDYYLVAINNVGNVSSAFAQNRTLMGRPEGLSPPVAVAISSSEVRVTWHKPSKPNGVIQEYRLTRINDQTKQRRVVYTGLNMTFTDRALEPFTGYLYVIEACTTHCASAEMASPIFTDQAAPAYVNATILLPVNYSAINVTWAKPPKPNGEIIRYNVSRVINSTFKIRLNPNDKGLAMSLVIDGLQPYTYYTFEVIACTIVGCTASPLASTRTLQAPPEGVHAPNLTVTGAREIEATWTEPDILNGVIVKYSLYRGSILVYNGTDVCYKNSEGKDVCVFQDKENGLQPVTTYGYSVAATTGGGTTRSGVSTATTPESSPENIPRPRLSVRSAYSISAEWDMPGQPNGNITSYAMVVNSTEHNAGVNRSALITGLNPFTIYSFRVKACTAKGCGLGQREHARTQEAPPMGQGAPSLVAREWNVVEISWSPPSSPNGIITQYDIYRRIGNGAPLVVCITSRLTCLNSGLLGYTVYSFSVRARNSAGFVDGPWRDVRTLEGPPQGINTPSLSVLNSSAIYVSWTAPSRPNGIVTHYEVRYRKELQVAENSNIILAARVTSDVFNVTVNGLQPHTDYQFLVAAINSRREGTSAWAIAKTKQAPPANLRPLQADKAADGKSLRIFWGEPENPNGVITHYNLYQDGVQIYRGAPREYRVSRLIPYTAYEFQLEACTAAGCTRGSVQVIFSAEVNPQGQGPPMIGFKNATAIQLTWKPPVVPNGVIIRYELYRTVSPVQNRRKRTVLSSSLIFSTNNTNKTDYQHTDVGLGPYTRNTYTVRAVNSGGFTDSDPVSVTTDEAPPTSMDPPLVTLVDTYSLNVSWNKPLEPNGLIQYFFVFRNGSIKHKRNDLSFLDQGLDPYTVYSYTVEVCTGGGCTMSPPSSRRTAQAAPSGVPAPALQAVSALAITISWRIPDKPNGIITRYELYEVGLNSPRYRGLDMSFTISNKEPYTKYSFFIRACTVAGCTQGPTADVRTKESAPRDLAAPTATVGGSQLVRVEWNAPRRPNGLILYYLLTRNGTQVYNGTDLRFNDRTVAPFTVYAYVVTAVNSADRVSSPPGFSSPTNPGAPDDVRPPTLEVLSATSIKVTWSAPGNPNGVITKYEVWYNFKESQGNAQIKDVGLSVEVTLTGLLAYTQYEVRIKACTKEGCSSGEARSARTFEAPPESQDAPDFQSLYITARGLLVTWNEPRKPNGFIVLYRLYRRGVSLSGGQPLVFGAEVSVTNVTNGSALAFNDTTVKPYFKYEYRVISANGAGETTSAWAVVQTLSAPPEQLKAPHVNKTNPYSLVVFILPPGIPNGEIRNYILEVSGQNKSDNLDTVREVFGLEPFTEYVLRVYACTDGGCARGPSVNWRTSEGVPAQFSAPRSVEINATTIVLEWDEPGKPNGIIQRSVVAQLFLLVCLFAHDREVECRILQGCTVSRNSSSF